MILLVVIVMSSCKATKLDRKRNNMIQENYNRGCYVHNQYA